MIQILIVDDHLLFRQGVKALLSAQPDLSVVAEASDYGEAIDHLRTCKIDLVILDLSMPGRDGLDLAAHIKAVQPALPIMVLTMHNEEEYASRAIKAGVAGYVTKDSTTDQLIVAVRRVAAGGAFISPKIAENLALRLSLHQSTTPLHTRLSHREYTIFEMLVKGKTVSLIARDLALSAKTISTHKMRLLKKMNLQNQSELVRYAMDHDLGSL